MKVHYLDSSVIIPLVAAMIGTREQRRAVNNVKAARYIGALKAKIRISVVVYAEVLRHFPDAPEVELLLKDFDAPLPLLPRHARRWARLQNRSGRVMGDNDAWVAAQAIEDGGVVVGHDKNAFHDRPDVEYIDFLKS